MIRTNIKGKFAYLFLQTLLEEKGIVKVKLCWGNRSHLAEKFIQMEAVEGQRAR